MKPRHKFSSTPATLAMIWLALGLTAIPSQAATDWDAKYKEMCSYDNMCPKLKRGDDWTAPAADIVDVLRTSKPLILAAAKLYGVDPRAIAGCILTENSLNLPLKHQAELWVAKFMKGSDHTLFGKRFGTGLGQLHDDIAYDVEPRAAAMEKRPQLKSLGEVHERMETLQGSIYYVAAILKDAQDVYKKHGFDITKDIGLQATLYNLGDYERRALYTKSSNRSPRINHFGFFVQHNEPLLASIVGMNSGAPSTAVLAGNSGQAQAALSPQDTSRATQITLTSSGKKMSKAMVLTEPLDATNLPDLCDQSAAKKKIGTLPKNTPFQVIAQDVDCKLNKWSLVASADGTVGWVKHSTLESKSTLTSDYNPCESKVDPACARSLTADTKKNTEFRAVKGGTYSFALNKISNCNSQDSESVTPSDFPVIADTVNGAQFQELARAAKIWNQSATQLQGNQNASALKKISDALSTKGWNGTSILDGYVWNTVFLAKQANFDKLTDFFSKSPTETLTDKDADEIVSTLKSTVIMSQYANSHARSLSRACPNIPEGLPQTSRFIQNFVMQAAQSYDEGGNSSGMIMRATQKLKDFCTKEISGSTEPSSSPAPSPSASSVPQAAGNQAACVGSADSHNADLSKTMSEYQKACGQMLKSDQEILAKAKTALTLTGTLAEVHECGFDLDEAAKRLSKLKATGCTKEIFVDSAPSFEFMATQKIDTIYKPSSTDGRFTITPKQNISCSEKGAAK